jgi:hypothetical protein
MHVSTRDGTSTPQAAAGEMKDQSRNRKSMKHYEVGQAAVNTSF